MAEREKISIKRKALRTNLDPTIYGTLAEIGAGQETARHFFRVGGASGTIAKSMSAYDMQFSDDIYGIEDTGRYVSQSRLLKMLNHEYELLTERLHGEKYENRKFFAFANTVTTLNYARTNEPHGWLGIRFQLSPDKEPNEIILHVRMYDNNTELQQRVIGELGVNLIFGSYKYFDNPEYIVESLNDDLSTNHLEIDMIRFSGPDFKDVDNRLIALLLVKKGFTDATIFGPDGEVYQPKDLLYKKDVLVLRGRFRPVTKVNWDMLGRAYDMFIKEPDVNQDKVISLAEMTLSLLDEGDDEKKLRKDFLDRADILSSIGQFVMVSNFHKHHKLAKYFDRCRVNKKGIIIGIMNLMHIYGEGKETKEAHKILSYFGKLFERNAKFYTYPYQPKGSTDIYTSKNMPVGKCLQGLHQYIVHNNCVTDIENYNPEVLNIFSEDIITQIKAGEDGWEDKVPNKVAELIKRNCLFDYPCEWVPDKKDFS